MRTHEDILREALGFVRYDPADGFTPRCVTSALDTLVTRAALADELERQNEELRQCAKDCKEKERIWIEECSRLRSLLENNGAKRVSKYFLNWPK